MSRDLNPESAAPPPRQDKPEQHEDAATAVDLTSPAWRAPDLRQMGRAFVDLYVGQLSEGQLVTLTRLDRVQVREIDDLFGDAMRQLASALDGRSQT